MSLRHTFCHLKAGSGWSQTLRNRGSCLCQLPALVAFECLVSHGSWHETTWCLGSICSCEPLFPALWGLLVPLGWHPVPHLLPHFCLPGSLAAALPVGTSSGNPPLCTPWPTLPCTQLLYRPPQWHLPHCMSPAACSSLNRAFLKVSICGVLLPTPPEV